MIFEMVFSQQSTNNYLHLIPFQIWEAVDPRQDGYVTRDGLYKALALTALAQQGKGISGKSLEMFADSGGKIL